MNEEAITNILVDVDFIEQSLRDSGQAHLSSIFDHLKLVRFLCELRRWIYTIYSSPPFR